MLLTQLSSQLMGETRFACFLPPYFDVSMKNLVVKRTLEEGEHSKKNFESSEKVSSKGHKKTCSKYRVVDTPK